MFDDYEKLKRDVESLQRKRDEKVGLVKELKRQLRKEFGKKDLKDAEKLLDKLHAAMIAASEQYVNAKEEYEEKLSKIKKKGLI